jgi:hypothetical protein
VSDKRDQMPSLLASGLDYLDDGEWRTVYLLVRNTGAATAKACRGKLTIAPLSPFQVKEGGIVKAAAVRSGSAAALNDVELPWAETYRSETSIHPGEVERLEIGRARIRSPQNQVDFTIPTGDGYNPPRIIFVGPGCEYLIRVVGENAPAVMVFGRWVWDRLNPTIEMSEGPTEAFRPPPEPLPVVRARPEVIEAWVENLAASMSQEWSRGTEIEGRVKRNRDARWPICLVWSGQGDEHPRTAIFLQPFSESEVAVTGVAPIDRRELTPEDRRAVLQAFDAALHTSSGTLVFQTKFVADPLSETIGPRAFALFQRFVRSANKSILHSSLDLPRWFDFLIQLHQDGNHPPREVLERALMDHSFSEEARGQLLDLYDVSDSLLDRYEVMREAR